MTSGSDDVIPPIVCPPGWWQCEYLRCKRRNGPVEKDGIVCGLLATPAVGGER